VITLMRAKQVAALLRARHPWLRTLDGDGLVQLGVEVGTSENDIVAFYIDVEGTTRRRALKADTTFYELDAWVQETWKLLTMEYVVPREPREIGKATP